MDVTVGRLLNTVEDDMLPAGRDRGRGTGPSIIASRGPAT